MKKFFIAMRKLVEKGLLVIVPFIMGLIGGSKFVCIIYPILVFLGGFVKVADEKNTNRFWTYLWATSFFALLYGAIIEGIFIFFGLDFHAKLSLWLGSFIISCIFILGTKDICLPSVNVPIFFIKWLIKKNEQYLETTE